MLKAEVCRYRETTKDPYDIYYFCRYSEEPELISEKLRAAIGEPAVRRTVEAMRRMFQYEDSKWVDLALDHMTDALGACTELHPVYRRLVRMALEELPLIEQQIQKLDQEMASLLGQHEDAVKRLAEVPGLGVDSAQQIIAEVGATAATFERAKNLASWVGACPGHEESAEVNKSHRSPKGSRHMKRILNQAANSAVRMKGCIFQIVYRRLAPRMGHKQAIGAIAHRMCRLIWLILHQGVRYEERGPAVSEKARRIRTRKMVRQLQQLGYHIQPPMVVANTTEAAR